MPRIPDIPGDVIEDVEHVSFLKEQVARLCGLDRYRFVPPIAGNLTQCLVLRLLWLFMRIVVVASPGFLAANQLALEERI